MVKEAVTICTVSNSVVILFTHLYYNRGAISHFRKTIKYLKIISHIMSAVLLCSTLILFYIY